MLSCNHAMRQSAQCLVVDVNPCFERNYIATLMGYADTKQAIPTQHVGKTTIITLAS